MFKTTVPFQSKTTFTRFTPRSVLMDEVNKFLLAVSEYDRDLSEYHEFANNRYSLSNLNDYSQKMSLFRDFLMSTDIKVLQERLCSYGYYGIRYITGIQLYHIFVLRTQSENKRIFSFDSYLMDKMYPREIIIYLDIYYQGLSPSECLDTIHYIWKSHPEVEFTVLLTYCDTLYKNIGKMETSMETLRDFFMAKDTEVLKMLVSQIPRDQLVYFKYITVIQLYHIYSSKAIAESKINAPLNLNTWAHPLSPSYIRTYVDIYYQGLSPSECLDNIHHIWKSHPMAELTVLLTYCDTLYKTIGKMETTMETLRDFFMPKDTEVLKMLVSQITIDQLDYLNHITVIQLYHIYSLKSTAESNTIFHFYLNTWANPFDPLDIRTYLDIYYQGLSPSECLDTIHYIWKVHPALELTVVLTYCETLLKNNNYQEYKQLIYSDTEYFLPTDKASVNFFQKCDIGGVSLQLREGYALIMLHLLHQSLSLEKMQNIKLIIDILNKCKYYCIQWNMNYIKTMQNCIDRFLHLIEKDQIFSVPPVAQFIEGGKFYKTSVLQAIIVYYERLVESDSFETSIEFLKCYMEYLIDVDEFTINHITCHTRQQYCVVLLRLLHHFNSTGESSCFKLIINAIQNLKGILHVNQLLCKCYCFMGSKNCKSYLSYENEMADNDHERDYRHNRTVQTYDTKVSSHDAYSINLLRTFLKIKNSNYYRRWYTEYMDDDEEEEDYYYDDFDYYYDDDDDDDDDDKTWLNKNRISHGHLQPHHKPENCFMALIERFVHWCGLTESVVNILPLLSSEKAIPETRHFVISQIVNVLKIKFQNSKVKYAQLVLDVNMDEKASKGLLVDQLTLQVAKILDLEETDAEDTKKVIYKCYCILRHATKNDNVKNIDLKGYKRHFTFIKYMENQEELKKQSSFTQLIVLLLLLLLASSSSGGHHKSAELKKFLSLKYAYDDAILYLLWCSGDVEINPGPTFQKLERLRNSQKERNWLYEICSILAKLSLGISEDQLSCKFDIWSKKPVDFTGDWSNARRKLAKDLNKFFYDLLCYCNTTKKICIPVLYQKEIDAFKVGDKTLLYKLFISRQETSEITKAIKCLFKYNGVQELQQSMSEIQIRINFDSFIPSSSVDIERSKLERDLAVTLYRICKGLNPTQKIKKTIWKEPPQGWNPEHKYFDPHVTRQRTEKNQDMIFINNLLEHMRKMSLPVPPEYKAIITAWEEQNTEDLYKFYTIQIYTSTIEHSLQYLKLEDLLTDNQEILKDIGLTLAPEWLDSNGTSLPTVKKSKASTKPVPKKTTKSRRGNHSSDEICSTEDSNATDTGSSCGTVTLGTSQQRHQSEPLEHTELNRKSRKRKVQHEKKETKNCGKRRITDAENFDTQPKVSSTNNPTTQDSDDVNLDIDNIVTLVEDLEKDYGLPHQTQQSVFGDQQNNNHQIIKGPSLSPAPSTVTTPSVSTQILPTSVELPDVDFWYADKMEDGQTIIKLNSEIDELNEELKKSSPELNSIYKSLNMSEQEVLDLLKEDSEIEKCIIDNCI